MSGFAVSSTATAGVFQPVTGQAVITQTTVADDLGANKAEKDLAGTKDDLCHRVNYTGGITKKIGQRVESHLLALRKKEGGGISKRRFRNQRGSGAALKIFTFMNGRPGFSKNGCEKFNNEYEHVGVVQTAINPDDRTKPEGFRTCATRIGGTVSMVHTGTDFIAANTPVFWESPDEKTIKAQKQIKGMPPDAIYPNIKAYSTENLTDLLADSIMNYTAPTDGATDGERAVGNFAPANSTSDQQKIDIKRVLRGVFGKKMSVWRRVIGWTLNDCEPGGQMDLILKR